MKYQRNTAFQLKASPVVNPMVRWGGKYNILGLFDSNHAHIQRPILGNEIDFGLTETEVSVQLPVPLKKQWQTVELFLSWSLT